MKYRKINIKKYSNYELMQARTAIHDLIAERKVCLLTPTEIGKRINFGSGAKVNKVLIHMGFQVYDEALTLGNSFMLTDTGKEFGEMFIIGSREFPTVCIQGEEDYTHLRHLVREGAVSWEDYDWEVVTQYNIRWKSEVLEIITDYINTKILNRSGYGKKELHTANIIK